MRVLSVLRDRSVATLFASQVFSALGDNVYNLALVWIAVLVAGARAGWIVSVQLVSTLLFSVAGGVAADRWDRRRAMVLADLGRAIANVGFSQRAILEKENQPSILELLRLVTEVTTDDTYLDRFSYRNGQIELAGVTSSTSTMIDQIGKAGPLATPTYLAPVSRGQDGLEHFNLSFKLTGGGAP